MGVAAGIAATVQQQDQEQQQPQPQQQQQQPASSVPAPYKRLEKRVIGPLVRGLAPLPVRQQQSIMQQVSQGFSPSALAMIPPTYLSTSWQI